MYKNDTVWVFNTFSYVAELLTFILLEKTTLSVVNFIGMGLTVGGISRMVNTEDSLSKVDAD